MPPPVSQDFLEDALATWERLRQWTDMNNYLCALRSSPFHRDSQSESDPYSLRLARRVTTVIDSLESRADVAVEGDMTPRGALLALAADVRLSLSPLPVLRPREWGVSCVPPAPRAAANTADGVAASSRDDWGAAVRRRSVTGGAMMEGLHILTCPGVQLRIEMAVARLHATVKEEMVGGKNHEAFPHSPNELQALRATRVLLEDFEGLYRHLLSTFPCMRTMGSSHIPVALMPVMCEQYYRMGEWVLETEFTAQAKPGTLVQAFDPKRLHAMIHRPDKTFPWGLRFGDNGKLAGVSAVVRSATVAGNKLHQILESTRGGLKIVTFNLKHLDFKNCDAEQVTEKLDKMSRTQKRIYLKLQRDPDVKPSVEQLAFYAVQPKRGRQQQQQQDELSCATLVLYRDNCSISWEVAITRDLVVMNVPVRILSPEAASFFSSYPKQVCIKGINGVEVTSAVQLEALSSTVNTIVLDLHIVSLTSLQEKKKAEKKTEGKTITEQSLGDINGHKTGSGQALGDLTTATSLASSETRHLTNIEEKPQPQSAIPDITEDVASSEDNALKTRRSRATSATLASVAQDCAPRTSVPPLEKKSMKRDDSRKTVTQTESPKFELRDPDVVALREEPLVSIPARKLKTKLHPDDPVLVEGENEVDIAEVSTKNGKYVKDVFARPPVDKVFQNDFTPSIDGDRTESPVLSADADDAPSSLFLSSHKEEKDFSTKALADGAVDVGPLKFPNNVTLNLLTLDEMVISRKSVDKKWGLSMETMGQEPNRTIRVTGLPLLMDQRLRQHPFHKLFKSHMGNWCILSVNGTSATRLPEVMDVMKHALHMRLKFHKRW